MQYLYGIQICITEKRWALLYVKVVITKFSSHFIHSMRKTYLSKTVSTKNAWKPNVMYFRVSAIKPMVQVSWCVG